MRTSLGSVVSEDAAIVQVVPGKIMDEREMREMAKEVRSIPRLLALSVHKANLHNLLRTILLFRVCEVNEVTTFDSQFLNSNN